MEQKACWNVFQMMVQLVQQFPRGNFSRLLASLIPDISRRLPIEESRDSGVSDASSQLKDK